MRLIDADAIRYDQLLNTGNKEHPLEWAVSHSRIDNMPTIEAEPVRRGRWVRESGGFVSCSVCNASPLLDGEREYVETPFCPSCGAKLEAQHELLYK